MAEISIITPAYNSEMYIGEAIESVLSQTYTDYEMIIVDDGSEDNTREIVAEYALKDSRIKLIKHEKNLGPALARNTALNIAKGKYIAFLDSDDKWLPEKLEKQYLFMQQNKYALTYTDYKMIHSNDKTYEKIILTPNQMDCEDNLKNTIIACLTVMVNREIVGDFNMPNLMYSEDYCTWHEILKRGHIAYRLNECLSIYRIRKNSLSFSKRKAAKKQWHVYRKYFKLSFLKSLYCFTCYAYNALKKYL